MSHELKPLFLSPPVVQHAGPNGFTVSIEDLQGETLAEESWLANGQKM